MEKGGELPKQLTALPGGKDGVFEDFEVRGCGARFLDSSEW